MPAASPDMPAPMIIVSYMRVVSEPKEGCAATTPENVRGPTAPRASPARFGPRPAFAVHNKECQRIAAPARRKALQILHLGRQVFDRRLHTRQVRIVFFRNL